MGSRAAPQLRIGRLQWLVGSFISLAGAMMLVAPHQFRSASYAALQPHLAVWGAVYLLAGIGLLASASLRPPRVVIVVAHVIAGGSLLLQAYVFALAGGWTGTSNWIGIGLATTLAPFLAPVPSPPAGERSHSLFALAIALGAALTGLTILLLPGQLEAPIYDVIRPYLPLFGLAFFCSGLALAYVQLLPAPPRRAYWAAHWAAGATLLAFSLASAIPLRAWMGIAYYGGFGAALVLLPWLEARLRRVDPTSLQVRLALTLAVFSTVPLIVVVATVSHVLILGEAGAEVGRIEAARDLSFVILLCAVVLAVAAGIVVARWTARPVDDLASAAARLARGDHNAPVPTSGVAEIVRLASFFGEMRDRLVARSAERERLLEEVQQRAAELDATIASLPSGVVITDVAGQPVRVNPAAEALLGYATEDKGRPGRESALAAETVDGKPLAWEDLPVPRALRGETVTGTVMVIHSAPNRTTWLAVSAAPIRTPGGKVFGAVASYSDITPLHELQEQREDVTRAISHDLRSPLTGILGMAQLLQRHLKERGLPAEIRLAEVVEKSAKRMNAMVQDLVESARLEAGQLEPRKERTDFGNLLTDIVERIGTSEERARVKLELSTPTSAVLADPARIERAVVNLVTNALKFSPPDRPVVLRLAQSDGEALLAVADEGAGIAADELPHLFDRFYRGKGANRTEGMGLGLYITRLIVEAHGGQVCVESEVGKGSTFYLTLPLAGA